MFISDVLDEGCSWLASSFVDLDWSDLDEIDCCPNNTKYTAEDDDNDGGGVAEWTVAFSAITIDHVCKTDIDHEFTN